MTPSIILLDVSTVGMAAFSLMLFRIASGTWWCRYGREVLLLAAAFIATIVATRTLALAGLISTDENRIINGFVALGFIFILANIVYLQHVCHRLDDGGRAARH